MINTPHVVDAQPQRIGRLRIEAGCVRDYDRLARFHYRHGRPATIEAIYRVVHHHPSVVGRYLGSPSSSTVVAVLIRSNPPLCCAGRSMALGNRYTGLSRADAARLVNREIRTISRVVVHPQWRGLGIAVGLVTRAIEEAPTPYVEAIASMGRVHRFFERAGMQRYEPPIRVVHARLLDALAQVGIPTRLLAMPSRVHTRIDRLEHDQREWCVGELQRWWRHCPRRHEHRDTHATPDARQLRKILEDASQDALAKPIYLITTQPQLPTPGS